MEYLQKRIASYYIDRNSSDLFRLTDEDKKTNSEVIYDVSVVLLTYNPSWKKLVATINSIVTQRNISVQLIISDDGSKQNYFRKIKAYLDSCGFRNYVMIFNKKNEGTVVNTLHGVKAATAEYIKIISPGDCLSDDSVLSSWIEYMRKTDAEWSFSDAIYYKLEEEMPCIVQARAHPSDIRPYKKSEKQKCRWNYIVFDDIALGAAVLAKRRIMVTYLKRIVGKVKYAEDNIWRLMMFDGIVGIFYSYPAIYYESDTGISNSKSDVWNRCLISDWDATTNEMILGLNENDAFQRDALRALHVLKFRKKIFHVCVKGKIGMCLYRRFFWRKTQVDNQTGSH